MLWMVTDGIFNCVCMKSLMTDSAFSAGDSGNPVKMRLSRMDRVCMSRIVSFNCLFSAEIVCIWSLSVHTEISNDLICVKFRYLCVHILGCDECLILPCIM